MKSSYLLKCETIYKGASSHLINLGWIYFFKSVSWLQIMDSVVWFGPQSA